MDCHLPQKCGKAWRREAELRYSNVGMACSTVTLNANRRENRCASRQRHEGRKRT